MAKTLCPDRKVAVYLPCPACGELVEVRCLYYREYVGESPHGMVQDFEEVTDIIHICPCTWTTRAEKALTEKALAEGRKE